MMWPAHLGTAPLAPWTITFEAGAATITKDRGRCTESMRLTPAFSAALANIRDELTPGVLAALWAQATADPDDYVVERTVQAVVLN